MSTRTVQFVVIMMGIITVVSIGAATLLEMNDHDATEVWKLAGIGLAALAGVLIARRGHENGDTPTTSLPTMQGDEDG